MNYSPLEQFEIKKILIYHLYVKCPVFDISITNGSITLLLILISYGLFNLKTIRSSYIIPSVWQFITEFLFSFILQMIGQQNNQAHTLRFLTNLNMLFIIPYFNLNFSFLLLLSLLVLVYLVYSLIFKLYFYRQLQYIIFELYSPINYILFIFNNQLKLDGKKFDRFKLFKFWRFFWWRCLFFVILTVFIEFNCCCFGSISCFLKKQGLPYYSSTFSSLYFYPHKNYFSFPIPCQFFGSLLSVSSFNLKSQEFSWENLYRFYTLGNCFFFVISSIYYIINIIFLGNTLFLSKLFYPGLFVFLGCLSVSLMFLDILLALITPTLSTLVKKVPRFFESFFFPIILLFFYFWKTHNSFGFFFSF